MSTETAGNSPEGQNALFTALSNHRRRYTLYACHQADGEMRLADLAEQVAAWEYDKTIPEITSDERKRVYTSLQQHHLDKLEKAGLIEVEGDRIRLTQKAERIDMYLEIVTEDTIPWALYYLGFALVGVAAVLITYAFELPSAVTPGRIGIVVLGLLALSAIAHYADTRRKHLDDAEIPGPGI